MQDVRALLTELAGVEDGAPVVTLCLDTHWKDEQQRERVRIFFEERMREALHLFPKQTPEGQGIRRTLEQLRDWVEGLVNRDLHEDARGVYVAASADRDLFQEIILPEPLEMGMYIDTRPRVWPVLEAMSSAPSGLLVTVESPGADILEWRLGELVDEQQVERPIPNRHKRGGWQQRRLQRHVRHHIQMVWKECATLLQRLAQEWSDGPIVLFGQDMNIHGFRKMLPEWVNSRIVAHLPTRRDRKAKFDAAREALADETIARDFDLVHHILRQGLADRSGAVGLEDTLLALNERRVRMLALSRRFDQRGFRCTNCDGVWVSGATGCVFCESPTKPALLREEVSRRCLRDGVELHVVPDGGPLDAYRGIGTILRRLSGEEHQRLGPPSAEKAGAVPTA